MVAYPNEGKIVYGIVVGGNDKDPDPTQSGGCRIYLPTEYGKDVNLKHLPFSRTMAQGNQHGITTFNPPPEHGSAVMCMKMPGHSGSGHLTILGTVPNDISKDSTIPGNSGAPFSDILGPIFKATTGISVPPDITSGGEGGSKRIKEKGKKHSHDLVKFLPSSATLWPMNGFKVPQSKNIATATQAFSSILSGDMLKMLPGMNMTLGSLMSNMPAALKNELFKNIPPEIGGAIDSMSGLMQSMEVSEGGGFSTAAKINPDVFFQNAANVLADARNIYDMVGAFQRLQSDTSLYGLESLPPVNITSMGGPFGDIPMQLDAFGNLTSLVPEPVQKLAETFSSLMSDGAGFPGVFPGANMFGGSAGVMNEMFNRLPAGELTKAVTQMQKNVAAGTKGRDNLNKMLGFGMQGAKLGLGILKQLK